MRGFSGAERAGIGERTRRLNSRGRRPGGRRLGALPARGRAGLRARPHAVLRGAGADGVRHGLGRGQCRRPRHPVADAAGDDHRRPSSHWPADLDAPRSRARDGACANQRQTRPRGADAAQRVANPRLLGAPGRGADDRGRFRPRRRFAAVVARARLRLMAQSAPGRQDQGGDGAAARPRRSVRRRCGQLAWPPSGDRRPAGVRQRRDAHPRCFGRAPSTGAIARRIRSRRGRARGLRRALEAADMPAWTRDAMGRIVWCNIPYAAAVDAPDAEAAIERAAKCSIRRCAGKCDGGQGDRRLDAPRIGGRRRRASNLRRRRGAHSGRLRGRRSRRFRNHGAERRIWSATRTTIRG